jgi:teichuronic acid biosynthesis glycosyltransferase TuaC
MRRPRILFISNLFPDDLERYRGLDNVTVLHQLSDRWEIKVGALRPWLQAWIPGMKKLWRPRAEDELFEPDFVLVRYVPKVGDSINHRLMANAVMTAFGSEERRGLFDVILASWLYPDGWAAANLAEKLGVPLVLIAQGSDVHRYLKISRRRRFILGAIRRSSAVITRSKSLAKLLAEAGVPEEKLKPVANGVDIQVFHADKNGRERENRGVRADSKLLLFVGNLLPVKNPQLLLGAFEKVVKARPEWQLHLCLAGKGPLQKELEDWVLEKGLQDRVRFLGPLPAEEIAGWMRSADLLCMSSRNEGLPNVVLEAMACGLPVMATDVGGIHEVVDAPWKGRLTPEGDMETYARGIEELLESPLDRTRIAEYGSGLSWEGTAAAYQSVLQLALDGGRTEKV